MKQFERIAYALIVVGLLAFVFTPRSDTSTKAVHTQWEYAQFYLSCNDGIKYSWDTPDHCIDGDVKKFTKSMRERGYRLEIPGLLSVSNAVGEYGWEMFHYQKNDDIFQSESYYFKRKVSH